MKNIIYLFIFIALSVFISCKKDNTNTTASSTHTANPGYQSGDIYTIAGFRYDGYNGDGIPATTAGLSHPSNVTMDKSGNIYFTDSDNSRVRKINTGGIISTIAGNGIQGYSGDGGPANSAELYVPNGIAVTGSGIVYFSDSYNERIRMVDHSGIISTIAGNGTMGNSGDGGPATAAELSAVFGITADDTGNIYVTSNSCIRKINTTGIISTIVGNGIGGYSGDGGPATAAELGGPTSLTIDGSGNMYISDGNFTCIRKVNTLGIISTIAGNGTFGYSGDGGPATAAELGYVTGVAVDGSGNVYIADHSNNLIRVVNTGGVISVFAGNGGNVGYSGDGVPAKSAELWYPYGLFLDTSGNLYFADFNNDRIREVIK